MSNVEHTISTSKICDVVGRKAIASAVGVGITQVGNAVAENRFPARWFFAVRQLCEGADIECPEYLFNFAGIVKPQASPEDAA